MDTTLENQLAEIRHEESSRLAAIMDGYRSDMAELQDLIRKEIAEFKAAEERDYFCGLARRLAREQIAAVVPVNVLSLRKFTCVCGNIERLSYHDWLIGTKRPRCSSCQAKRLNDYHDHD